MKSRHFFSLAEERATFEEEGIADAEIVVSNVQSEGRYSIIYARWLSTFEVPLHYHKTHSETFYVLDGQVEWTVEGETRVLSAGDAVYIPPNATHRVRVLGDRDALNLLVYEPGGYEEQVDYKMNFTPEELEDPDVKDRIRKKNDFHVLDTSD
ncbi:MAG TPA: cupin domain-containing protein [Chloroflexi bacterium]|nr:cupin domain-containing protein [Chloroflexota bacterium]